MFEKYKLDLFQMVKVDYSKRLLRILMFIAGVMIGSITRGIGYTLSPDTETGLIIITLLGTLILLGSIFLGIIAVIWWIIKNAYRIYKQGIWKINPLRLANELVMIGLPLYMLGPVFFTVTTRTIIVSDRTDPITYLGGNILFTSILLYGLVSIRWLFRKAVLVYHNRSN